MYLRGSKWSMNHRRRRISIWRVGILSILIAAAIYVNQVVVPATPPLFVPTPTATRDPASYIAEAENLFVAGKLAPAIEAYKKAIQANPSNPSNFIELSRLQIFNRDYDEALANAENALVIAPNNSVATALRGWALFFLNDYLAAEAALKNAIELDANNALAHAFYAELIGKQVAVDNDARIGGIEDAINESRLAIDLGPNLLETHRARGYVLEWTRNYTEAIQEFQKAIEINRNIGDLHLELGIIYSSLEEPQVDLAVDAFNKAITLNPTDPLPRQWLASSYANSGEYAKAIQYAEEAVKYDPTNPFMYGSLGVYYRKNQQLEQAVEALRLSVRGGTTADGEEVMGLPLSNDWRILRYYSNYGLALATLNECAEAVQIASAMIQGVPNDEDAVYNAQFMLDTCKANLEGTATPADTEQNPEAVGTKQP